MADPVPTTEPAATFAYPDTRREDIVEELAGRKVADPYRWLEDEASPEVAAWMRAQDDFTRSHLGALPGREALAERVAALTYIDSISPPYRRGDRFFYSRSHKDKEKSVYYVKQGRDGDEQVLIDPNLLSDDGSISVSGMSPSHSGRWVAYKLSENNADAATMYVRDLETGRDTAIDVIRGARYAHASWTRDDKGFYYVALPVGEDVPVAEMPGHAHVRYHRLGEDPASDEIVVPATGDPTMFLGAGVSEDGRWLFLYKTRGENNEVYFRDRRKKNGAFTPLAVGFDASYGVDVYQGRFYVTTNADAPNFRVFAVDPKSPDRAAWTEIVAERDHPLQGAYIVGGHLVLSYLRDAHDRMEIHDLKGNLVREVDLPGLGSASGLIGREDDDEAYYAFSSFTTPPQIYRTSVSTGDTELWAKIEYPVDTSRFESKQVWFPSKDGTRVSMFVVHAKGIELDGSHPTLLYGYGGFNVTLGADFSPYALAWVERGGVYAKANLRGGGEYGEDWHSAGMLDRKQNVFDDFIAAAEWLVAEGWTKPARLAIGGRSNGGLLVGATMTQRPDLFAVALPGVGVMDMLRFNRFTIGWAWESDYGSPADPGQFEALYAYSPYHNLEAGTRYPATLVYTADHDDRVVPAHSFKFAAALQHAHEGDTPVLIRIDTKAGHGKGKPVSKSIDEWADLWAFTLANLGVEPAGTAR